jgi:hypothetical protein
MELSWYGAQIWIMCEGYESYGVQLGCNGVRHYYSRERGRQRSENGSNCFVGSFMTCHKMKSQPFWHTTSCKDIVCLVTKNCDSTLRSSLRKLLGRIVDSLLQRGSDKKRKGSTNHQFQVMLMKNKMERVTIIKMRRRMRTRSMTTEMETKMCNVHFATSIFQETRKERNECIA